MTALSPVPSPPPHRGGGGTPPSPCIWNGWCRGHSLMRGLWHPIRVPEITKSQWGDAAPHQRPLFLFLGGALCFLVCMLTCAIPMTRHQTGHLRGAVASGLQRMLSRAQDRIKQKQEETATKHAVVNIFKRNSEVSKKGLSFDGGGGGSRIDGTAGGGGRISPLSPLLETRDACNSSLSPPSNTTRSRAPSAPETLRRSSQNSVGDGEDAPFPQGMFTSACSCTRTYPTSV